MKRLIHPMIAIGVLSLPMAAIPASAVETEAATKPAETCTGILVSIDPTEHLFSIKRTWHIAHKHLNIGQNCSYTTLDNKPGKIGDLRPGEKVRVDYQKAHGTLIANRIEQQPMRFEGMLSEIDYKKHTFTLHHPTLDKDFRMSADCVVVFKGSRPGKFTDLKPGTHLLVTYETPENEPTAYRIEQTSLVFTGTVTALDLSARTLKARAPFDSKKFHVGNNCSIVLKREDDGQQDHLGDLKMNQKLVFSYDRINGADEVSRISLAEAR